MSAAAAAGRRPLALPPAAIDRWCQYVQNEVTHIAEATGFVNFELSYNEVRGCRNIFPEHYIVTFTSREKNRQRLHSSLLSLRLTPEDSLPEQVQVGVEVRGRDGESVVCSGEYVEFELLSSVNDASKHPPLRICAGPVRVNSDTGQREFMRIDLGRCVRQIVTDIVDDSKHKGQKLVRSRWWICVEVLRLVCNANYLDCTALDVEGARPLEWVLCLVDEKSVSPGSPGGPTPQHQGGEKSVDELAKFIDGSNEKKKKKKKKAKGDGNVGGEDVAEDAEEEFTEVPGGLHFGAATSAAYPSLASLLAKASESAAATAALVTGLPQTETSPLVDGGSGSRGHTCSGADDQALRIPGGSDGALPRNAQARPSQRAPPRPTPPPGWSRTVDLAPALVDLWRDSAGADVRHVAESTGFVYFMLSFSIERRCRLITPTHYVIAFPQLVGGQQKYHSALLTLRIVTDPEIPESTQDGAESIEFELLAREREAPVQTPLRFTAGPVRVNDKTLQRESMRLDLGNCVRWAKPESVEGIVGGVVQRLVRQRWWVGIETLRLVCYANDLDASGLDTPGAKPLEWIACLVDERTPPSVKAGGLVGDASNAGGGCGGTTELKKNLLAGDPVDNLSAATGSSKKKKNGNRPSDVGEAVPKAGSTCVGGAVNAKTGAKAKAPQAPPPAKATAPVKTNATSATPVLAPDKAALESAGSGRTAANSDEEKRPPPAKQSPPNQRTLALPSALIESWCQFARKTVSHVAEATGFVHFDLRYDAQSEGRTVTPEHYIIAFPNRDKGRQRYHSALLTMRVVKEADIPPEHVVSNHRPEDMRGVADYLEFELLLRVHEAPVQQELRITTGPVRVNAETGQRESMRIDLGRCVRQIATDVIDDPRGKRVVRNRWWICIETFRLVLTANSLDCKALDEPGRSPVEWVMCLVDERSSKPDEPPPQDEDRNIDDLVDFIDGKGNNSKKKKKKNKDKGAVPEVSTASFSSMVAPRPVHESADAASAATLSRLRAQLAQHDVGIEEPDEWFPSSITAPTLSASQAAAAALSQATHPFAETSWGKSSSSPLIDPVAQAQAAAQLLAECAAVGGDPQQVAAAAAAAEAARRAAEVARRPQQRQANFAPFASLGSSSAAPRGAVGVGGASNSALDTHTASASSRASRPSAPLLGGWEPTPLPSGASSEDWAFTGSSANPEHSASRHSPVSRPPVADATSRALDDLAGLETLLKGLRSEFAQPDHYGDY